MDADDNTDIFGETVPSPATAKAPESQEHLPVAPEPSPVRPRTVADLVMLRDVLQRLTYPDWRKFVKGVEAHKKNQTSLMDAIALWSESDD